MSVLGGEYGVFKTGADANATGRLSINKPSLAHV
jgi:hypothetical protein